jgi:hypothetical protein
MKRLIQEEDLSISERKTEALPCTTRQVVVGLVVKNTELGIAKNIRRNLRQTLHKYTKKDFSNPSEFNSRAAKASLTGTVAHIKHINPSQGLKLQKGFERIKCEKGATVYVSVVKRSYSRATFRSIYLAQYYSSFSGHKLLNVCDKSAKPALTFKVLK